MKNETLLEKLRCRLEQLAEQLAPLAYQRSAQARFDNQLFHTQNTRLQDYLDEARQCFLQLCHAVSVQRSEQIVWLTERLVAQIAALQREQATWNLRKNERQHIAPAPGLYEKLIEHQEFERRLKSMITDRELRLAGTTATDVQLQREIATLEGRLQRCRNALKRIERSIELHERQG